MPMPLRRALGLALAALLVACNATVPPSAPTTPSASPSPAPSRSPAASPSSAATPEPDPEEIYRAIEDAVIPLRGLEPKVDIEPQLLSEEELREETERSFNEDNPPALIEANEVLYRALGMLAEDDSLRDLFVELLGDQVAGFYDPEVDELFVVTRSGGLGVEERVTYAHEFTHALQDQYFDLESYGISEVGEGDRNTAVLALIEGDATAVMTYWAQAELTPTELLALVQASLDPEATEVLNRMPPILRESLTFPYDRGLQLVLGLQVEGGWEAVDEAYEDPPASTEQVLHPEKYDAREAPIEVELPADLADRMGEGWENTYEDTFGEFQFGVWLRNAIGRADEGDAAAAGWGGDRFAVLQGPDDAWALVMRTEWDQAADATQFFAAATAALEADGQPNRIEQEGRAVSIVVASDEEVVDLAVEAAG
jgi:hypothetical protein